MTQKLPAIIDGDLLKEISLALAEIGGWGSLEIYIQNGKVTQITKRAIKKTDHDLKSGA